MGGDRPSRPSLARHASGPERLWLLLSLARKEEQPRFGPGIPWKLNLAVCNYYSKSWGKKRLKDVRSTYCIVLLWLVLGIMNFTWLFSMPQV